MQTQNTPKTPATPATPDLGPGIAALQKVLADSAARNQAAQTNGTAAVPPPAEPPPPSIDTGSVMGLLKSLKDRLSYAVYGPPAPAQPPATPPASSGGGY